ncbi:MAG: response regulator transcription factor, partial [Actinomycetota bacterium]|nr:response regulator transcription factor [Actinomycetota bacterium]
MTHRLLIVDDNSDYRTLVRYALADCAVKVVGEASTPTAGIARARELQPDLVLLDIVHRGEDGLGAIRPLQEAAPKATIVAVAAYAEHELWSRAPNVHNVAYLPKSTLPTRLC